MYPLMDHDHAFDEEKEILSQTWEGKTLKEAAKLSQEKLNLPVQKLLEIEKPKYLKEDEWEQVKIRVKSLIK